MNRLLRLLLIFLFFYMGTLLMLIPWTGAWERNYFLSRYPALIPFLLNPSVRGAISGLGVLDLLVAAGMIWRRRPTTVATRS